MDKHINTTKNRRCSSDSSPPAQHTSAKSRTSSGLLWWCCLLVCVAVFCFSGWKLFQYWNEGRTSDNYTDDLTQQAVASRPEQTPADSKPGQSPPEQAPITVDFAALQAQNPEVVAWLYSEDTLINYPIAQAADNDYYLHRLLDGTENQNGTLFMDFRNQPDFSDGNTLIYGHNMKTGKMFGTLDNYKKQEYFDQHPVMWLLTPQGDYKIELAAGWVIRDDDPLYLVPADETGRTKMIEAAYQKTTFASGVQVTADDTLVTLSTCSYETDIARYVLLGRLVKLVELNE